MKFNSFYGTARFLAHDIEEDDEDMKSELYIWALGFQWEQHYQEMLTSRDVLWKVIGHRGIVSRACCEKVHTKKLISLQQCC
jgi:speedy protein